MINTYYFEIVKEGTPESPHFTFAEINNVSGATVNYFPQLNIVEVNMEVTTDQDQVLSGTDLTEIVFIDRVKTRKELGDSIRTSKNPRT